MRRALILMIILIPSSFIGQQSQFLDSIFSLFETSTQEDKIKALISYSEHYRFVDFEKCILLGHEAILVSNKINDKTLKANVFESIGLSYYYEGILDSAYKYYQKALPIYQENLSSKRTASCLSKIALLYTIWSNYQEALSHHLRSFQIRKKTNNRIEMANSMSNIGNIYFYMSDFKKSLESYFSALSIYNELDNKNNISMALNNIGSVFKQIEDFEKAIYYLEQAELNFRIAGDDKALSRTLLNLANVYNFDLKDFQKAKKYYLESLELKKKSNDNIRIALVYNNLGTMYANLEKYLQASNYFYLAKEIYEEMNDMSGLIMVNHNIGNIHQATEDYAKAIHFYQKSLSKAIEYKYIDYISSNQKALFECYAAICNKEKFNEYFQLYSAGVDTIIDRINRTEILEIESKYKYAAVNKQNETLQDQLIIQRRLVNKYRNYAYGAAAIAIIVLVVFGLILILKK